MQLPPPDSRQSKLSKQTPPCGSGVGAANAAVAAATMRAMENFMMLMSTAYVSNVSKGDL